MKKLFLSMFAVVLVALTFSACAPKMKQVDEPYYDRANNAASKAHDRLNKD